MKKEITFQDYEKIEICSGTILEASINVKAKKPAYVLKIDFGEKIGIKTSSAQITHYYQTEKDRKSTHLNSSHIRLSRMPSSA